MLEHPGLEKFMVRCSMEGLEPGLVARVVSNSRLILFPHSFLVKTACIDPMSYRVGAVLYIR